MKHSKHYNTALTKYETIMKAHQAKIEEAETMLEAEKAAKDKATAAATAADKDGKLSEYLAAKDMEETANRHIKLLSDRLAAMKKEPADPAAADALLKALDAETEYIDAEVKKTIIPELERLHTTAQDLVSAYRLVATGKDSIIRNVKGTESNVIYGSAQEQTPQVLKDLEYIFRKVLKQRYDNHEPGAVAPTLDRPLTDRQKKEFDAEVNRWNM